MSGEVKLAAAAAESGKHAELFARLLHAAQALLTVTCTPSGGYPALCIALMSMTDMSTSLAGMPGSGLSAGPLSSNKSGYVLFSRVAADCFMFCTSFSAAPARAQINCRRLKDAGLPGSAAATYRSVHACERPGMSSARASAILLST